MTNVRAVTGGGRAGERRQANGGRPRPGKVNHSTSERATKRANAHGQWDEKPTVAAPTAGKPYCDQPRRSQTNAKAKDGRTYTPAGSQHILRRQIGKRAEAARDTFLTAL